MRTYQKTHSWIKFQLVLQEMGYKTWLLLGEAQSKCEHVSGVPLLPDVAQYLHSVFLAKGVLATTAIEGNTLNEAEVMQRIEGKLKLPPSKAYLGQEIDNIIEACNSISQKIMSGKTHTLRTEDIKEYNALVLKGLHVDEDVRPGEFRGYSVTVGRYRGVPAEDNEYLIGKLCDWLNNGFNVSEENKIVFGILKAIIAHIYLAWIHPFGDGNGRTARLIEFQILLASGVPSTAAHLLSNHYNQTRSEYYRQLDQTSRSNGDLLPYIQYALQGFIDGLREQMTMIRGQQLTVHWINYIHEVFRNKDSTAFARRRRLALDLTEQANPVPLNKIRYITPRIAEAYAKKTDKTIQRDLNVLENLGLIQKTATGIRVKRETMLAFLPNTRID